MLFVVYHDPVACYLHATIQSTKVCEALITTACVQELRQQQIA